MKLLSKAALASSLVLFSSLAVAESRFVAGDNSPGTKICISAAEDSNMHFKQTVKHNRVPMKVVAKKLLCNGERITSFAKYYGNNDVYQVLSRYRQPIVEIRRDMTASL